jgi:hypothetical protein
VILRFDRGLISQDKVAEIAGLTRADFIDAQGRANVSDIQTTVEELMAELVRPLYSRRSCIGVDSASPGKHEETCIEDGQDEIDTLGGNSMAAMMIAADQAGELQEIRIARYQARGWNEP